MLSSAIDDEVDGFTALSAASGASSQGSILSISAARLAWRWCIRP